MSGKGNRNKLFIVITISTLGLACLPGGILGTGTSVPVPPTETLPPPTAIPPAGNGLNAEGPWLLLETDPGLWALNPHGTGLTQLTDVDTWGGNLQDAIQPGGDQVVFLSAWLTPSPHRCII